MCSMPAWVSHLHFNAVTAEASTPKQQIERKTTLPNGLNMFPHIDYKPKAAWKLERKWGMVYDIVSPTLRDMDAQMLENMVEIHQQIVILCCCVQKMKIKRFRDTEEKKTYFPEICPL